MADTETDNEHHLAITEDGDISSVIPIRTAAATISIPGTLVRHKSWLILVANAYRELLTEDEHTISFHTLASRLKWDGASIKRLKSDIEALAQTTVRFNMFEADDDDDWLSIHQLIAEAVDDGQGNIRYSFPPRLRRKLADPAVFSLLALDALHIFGSKYSLALYLALNQFEREGKTPQISVNGYRQLMGVGDDEYTEFKRLKPRVITEPLAEVCAKSDLDAEVILLKEGKNVTKIQFVNIRRKPDHDLTLLLQAHARPLITLDGVAEPTAGESGDGDRILEASDYRTLLMTRYMVTGKALKEIMEALENGAQIQALQSALERVDAYRATSTVGNLGAYTAKTVLNALRGQGGQHQGRKGETPTGTSPARAEAEHRQRTVEKFRAEFTALAYRELESAYERLPVERKKRLMTQIGPKLPPVYRAGLDATKPLHSTMNTGGKAFFLGELRRVDEMKAHLPTVGTYRAYLANRGIDVDVVGDLIAEAAQLV